MFLMHICGFINYYFIFALNEICSILVIIKNRHSYSNSITNENYFLFEYYSNSIFRNQYTRNINNYNDNFDINIDAVDNINNKHSNVDHNDLYDEKFNTIFYSISCILNYFIGFISGAFYCVCLLNNELGFLIKNSFYIRSNNGEESMESNISNENFYFEYNNFTFWFLVFTFTLCIGINYISGNLFKFIEEENKKSNGYKSLSRFEIYNDFD